MWEAKVFPMDADRCKWQAMMLPRQFRVRFPVADAVAVVVVGVGVAVVPVVGVVPLCSPCHLGESQRPPPQQQKHG